MGVKLSKFPVTASDGTEYRVTIKEDTSDLLDEKYVTLRVYTKRKRFGYRKVYQCTLWSEESSLYDSRDPDYVYLAGLAVRWYEDKLAKDIEEYRKIVESIVRAQMAVRKFAEWDGKITEVSAE